MPQLLPHVGRMILVLLEGVAVAEANATSDGGGAASDGSGADAAARMRHLGVELLFGLLHAARASSDAAKMARRAAAGVSARGKLAAQLAIAAALCAWVCYALAGERARRC